MSPAGEAEEQHWTHRSKWWHAAALRGRPSTDLDDVYAVQRVDEEEARGPVDLVPALAGRGQLLVVRCK